MGALTYQSSISNGDLHFKLYEKTVDIAKSDVVEAKFNVDPTLGRNLKLSVFNLDSDKSVLTMVLVGPEDQAADTKFDFDTTTASVKVDLAKVISIVANYLNITNTKNKCLYRPVSGTLSWNWTRRSKPKML